MLSNVKEEVARRKDVFSQYRIFLFLAMHGKDNFRRKDGGKWQAIT